MDMLFFLLSNFGAALISMLVSILSGILFNHFSKRQKEVKRKIDEAIENSSNYATIQWQTSSPPLFPGTSNVSDSLTRTLRERLEDQVQSQIQTSPRLTPEVVYDEVQSQFDEVSERLTKIEERFPDEKSIDKVASINDALLSERIDQLSKQVSNLEQKILTRWDVALTVSKIFTGIIFVVGATYSFLKAFQIIP